MLSSYLLDLQVSYLSVSCNLNKDAFIVLKATFVNNANHVQCAIARS